MALTWVVTAPADELLALFNVGRLQAVRMIENRRIIGKSFFMVPPAVDPGILLAMDMTADYENCSFHFGWLPDL